MNRIKTISIIGLLTISCGSPVYADIAVIVHPDNHLQLDKDQVRDIYLGKVKVFDNGVLAHRVDLKQGDKSREIFLKEVLNKSENHLFAYWARMLFTSKGREPQKVDNAVEVIQIVSSNTSAIGYVDTKDVTDKVRVLLLVNE